MPLMKSKVEVFEVADGAHLGLDQYRALAEHIIRGENLPLFDLRLIFVDNDYLKGLHLQFLNDGSETDVMTFALGEAENQEAEIYVSIEQAKKNAAFYQVPVKNEIARLVIHGLLHLQGYDDRTKAEQKLIRELEDVYLNKYWNPGNN